MVLRELQTIAIPFPRIRDLVGAPFLIRAIVYECHDSVEDMSWSVGVTLSDIWYDHAIDL